MNTPHDPGRRCPASGPARASGTSGRVAFARRRSAWSMSLVAAASVLATGCEEPDLSLPTAEEVAAAYQVQGDLSVEMSGNVAQISIVQSDRQLRRGGALWAKVGPYIYLFSAETRALFDAYGGLAGVRVVTTSGRREVARALLTRDALNDTTWRRSINISGIARRDGTARPAALDELVRWGEDHTEFEYNSRYVRR